MNHPIYKVTAFSVEGAYTLRVTFNDGAEQVIDFQPVLAGRLLGPLRDLKEFERVRIDPEVHTLVWPKGADFDPATLHDWPRLFPALREQVERWNLNPA